MPFESLPYAAPVMYDPRQSNDRITELLMRQGDIAARGAAAQGDIWGNTVANLGQQVGGALQQRSEQKAAAKREQMTNDIMARWNPADPETGFKDLAKVYGAKDAMYITNGMMDLHATVEKAKAGEVPTMEQTKNQLLALGALEKKIPGYVEKNYDSIRAHLGKGLEAHYGTALPEAPTPEATQMLHAFFDQETQPEKGVVVGGKLVSPTTGKVIYEGEKEPPKTLAEAALRGDTKAYQLLLKAETDKARAGHIGDPDEAIQLTPAAMDMAARLYSQTGALPPMGQGKKGAAVRQQIINRAAELTPGADIAGNKASYAADSGSLKKMQGMVDAVSAFESTASKNADQLDKLLDKIPDYGATFANKPARALASKLGSEDMAKFNTLRQSVANEYARIISNPGLSGVMSDSAREEGSHLLDPDATPGQIRAAIKTLQAEAKNRHTEYQGQLSMIKQRMSGKPAETGGAAPSEPSPAVGSAGSKYKIVSQ